MSSLVNKKIVVAGGSSGIGLATAELLAAQDADVHIISRNKTESVSGSITSTAVDATNRADLDAYFKGLGKFDDLVITLSGGKGGGLFKELNLADLRSGVEAKLFPQLNTLQAALPYINTAGSVVMVSAISSRSRLPGTSGLAAINAAIEAMVPTLAKELKPLRINAVSPGVIDTPWWNFMDADTKQKSFDEFSIQIPVGRVGNANDVAQSIVFLLSNEYITGTVLEVDGGIRL